MTLFVSNISSGANANSFRNFLIERGYLARTITLRFKSSSSASFAFVDFADAAVAREVIKTLDGARFMDLRLNVQAAAERPPKTRPLSNARAVVPA